MNSRRSSFCVGYCCKPVVISGGIREEIVWKSVCDGKEPNLYWFPIKPLYGLLYHRDKGFIENLYIFYLGSIVSERRIFNEAPKSFFTFLCECMWFFLFLSNIHVLFLHFFAELNNICKFVPSCGPNRVKTIVSHLIKRAFPLSSLVSKSGKFHLTKGWLTGNTRLYVVCMHAAHRRYVATYTAVGILFTVHFC